MNTEINTKSIQAYWRDASKRYYDTHKEAILEKRRERAYLKQTEKYIPINNNK